MSPQDEAKPALSSGGKVDEIWKQYYEFHALPLKDKLVHPFAQCWTTIEKLLKALTASEAECTTTQKELIALCEKCEAFDWHNYPDGLDTDDALLFLAKDRAALSEALTKREAECTALKAEVTGLREALNRIDDSWFPTEEALAEIKQIARRALEASHE